MARARRLQSGTQADLGDLARNSPGLRQMLMLEKDRAKPSTVFTKIIDLSWLWLIIAVLVSGFERFYFFEMHA
jgi:hypothetical protein